MSVTTPKFPGGTSGQVGQLSDLEVDGTTAVIDEVNNRLGIGLAVPKTRLTVEGAVTLKEQAAADTDTAAYGQLWVKSATPNELYFTTDAGNDIQITSGTAMAFVGDITGVTAGVGLSGGGTTGALTLTLDLSELSDVTPANGDKLATLDSDGSTEQLTTVASLATLFAGTGLTASNSVIGVDASQTQITAVGTIGTGVWQGTAIAQAYIANDAINGDKIADDAIDSEHYTDGSIDTAHIADDQVTLAKMAGLARGKFIVGDASGNPSALAAGANGKILVADANGDPSWTTLSGDASLSAGALTIATGAIEHAMLGGDCVDGDNIADDSINSEHYVDGSIDTAHIADDQITLAKMAGLARGKIIYGDASGNPAALAAGANGKLLVADANGDLSWTTVSGDIGLSAGAMTIQTGAVEHAMLGGDCVDGDNIADDSINSEHYVDGSIDTAHIADDQVTLAKMAGITRGSIIYGNASGDPALLAKGSANYVLTSDGTDIAWAAAAGGAAADDANTILHMQVFS